MSVNFPIQISPLIGMSSFPRTKRECENKNGFLQSNDKYAVSKANNIEGKFCKNLDSSLKPNLIF